MMASVAGPNLGNTKKTTAAANRRTMTEGKNNSIGTTLIYLQTFRFYP